MRFDGIPDCRNEVLRVVHLFLDRIFHPLEIQRNERFKELQRVLETIFDPIPNRADDGLNRFSALSMADFMLSKLFVTRPVIGLSAAANTDLMAFQMLVKKALIA